MPPHLSGPDDTTSTATATTGATAGATTGAKAAPPGAASPGADQPTENSAESADLAVALTSIDAADLGARVREVRIRRSLTQKALSEIASVSNGFVSRIESGVRKPDLKTLYALAKGLRTTAHELLLGLTPKEWRNRRVELEWARLALESGRIEEAMEQITGLLREIPVKTALHLRALYMYGLALEATGDMQSAALALEEVVEGDMGDAPALDVLNALSRVYRQNGELPRAQKIGERAQQYVTDLNLGGTPEAVRLTLTVAAAHIEAGDYPYAARLCSTALHAAERLDNPTAVAQCYWNASIIESMRGKHHEAVALAQKALFVMESAENGRYTARLRTQVGLMYLKTDPPKPEKALVHLRRSQREMSAVDSSPSDRAQNRLGQARVNYLNGEYDVARRGAQEVIDMAAGAPQVTAEAHILTGQIAMFSGDVDGAFAHYEQAILLLSGMANDRGIAQTWYELAFLCKKVGRFEQAFECFERAGASNGLQQNTLVDHVARAEPTLSVEEELASFDVTPD